jgi:transposase-like protein
VRIRYIGLGLALVVVLWWLTAVTAALARGRNISKCPKCESTRIRRSWPHVADKILFPAYIKPYRCESCQNRFYAIKRVNEIKRKRAAAGGAVH